jgi:hypothetical protein
VRRKKAKTIPSTFSFSSLFLCPLADFYAVREIGLLAGFGPKGRVAGEKPGF